MKGKSKLTKIFRALLIVPVILFLLLNMSGCLQFRMSNAKKIRQFEKEGLELVAEKYVVGDREMNFVYIPNEDTSTPAVIYIHGSPGSSQDFFRTMKDTLVHTQFLPVSVDRPGFGHSGFGRSEPSLDQQSKDIYPVLDKFKDRKIILIGHSFGGPMVVKLAMDYPELVDGLIIVAGSVAPELEPEEKWRKTMDWGPIKWITPRAFVSSNQEIMALKEELIKLLPNWKEITQPVVVVQGTKDNLVPPGNAQFADSMLVKSEFKDIQMEAGGNHFIPFSREYLIVNALVTLQENL